jgi:Ca2+-binding RTX toxin-like protein
LNGAGGNETMTSGTGNDQFVFNTAPDALTNHDTITDFTAGGDKIVLDHAIFAGLSPGALAAGNFALSAPADADDFIVYDQASGALSYYAHGNTGAGVQFATLTNLAALTNADIIVA